MIDRLEKIQEKYLRISEELNQAKDPSSLKNLYKERSRLTPLYLKVEEYLKIYKDRKDAEELIQSEKDEEMHSMLKEEIREANLKLETLEREFEILLLPPDPNSGKTFSWKSEPEPAEKKQGYSLRIYLECILNLRTNKKLKPKL